jgi:hypothetical protein
MVDGDVTVDSGETLVIRPPAQITFHANTDVEKTWDTLDCDVVINGGLRAEGTETDSILFTSTEEHPDAWERVLIDTNATAGIQLAFARLEYAYIALDLQDSNADTIDNCTFWKNAQFALRDSGNGLAMIRDNYIRGPSLDSSNTAGIYLENVETCSTRVRGNTIEHCYRGLWAEGCQVDTKDNIIKNVQCGMWLVNCNTFGISSTTITDTIVEQYIYVHKCTTVTIDHGCFASDPDPVQQGINVLEGYDLKVRLTDIMNFSSTGVLILNAFPDLGTSSDWGGNQICSDSLGSSGKLVWYKPTKGGGPVGTIRAEYNWWGSDPPDSDLFVSYDDSVEIDYDPWLEDPPRPPQQQKIATAPEVPPRCRLWQNYPNPFNPVTGIQFTVGSQPSPAHTTLKIYNILGRLVRTLVDEEKAEGSYTVYWDGRSDKGKEVSSGLYFYKLEAGHFTDVKKMVILR